jgi:hypothetical protein
MAGLRFALKEWAVICKALAEGRQALLLRKGGIAEDAGEFRLEHTRFWLFPTWTHQQESGGLREEALPLLEEARSERPPAGELRITHYAEVTGVYHVRDLTAALMLAHLHLWSEETVRKRFAYRTPGLFVMPVRVWRAAQTHVIPDAIHYEGCRSWVGLEAELPTEGAAAVLDDAALANLSRQLDVLLNPTALA